MLPERSQGTRASRARNPILLSAALVLTVAACSQTPAPSPALSSTPTIAPTATPTQSPTPTPPLPTPDPFDSQLLDHRFTVLLVGEDQSAARRARGYIGDNTDALMIVSVDPGQKRVVMINLPRDTVNIPLANGQLWTGKVNAIANSYGIDVLRQAMATLLNIRVPYYVKVNMDDFVDLVDAVGGISVKVKTLVREDRWGLYLTPGQRVHLDGRTALHFARARHWDSDYARAARQQQVIHALALKYTNRKTKVDVVKVLRTLAGMKTNLPMKELPTLTELARRAARADYVTQVLMPPQFSLGYGDFGDGRGWVIIPNVDAMRHQVRLLFNG